MAGVEEVSAELHQRHGKSEKDEDESTYRTLVCLEFSPDVTEDTVDWLVSKITDRGCGLIARKLKNNKKGQWVLHITASPAQLLVSAELMEIRKRCKDGTLREISAQHLDLFLDSEDPDEFLTMAEKQRIILHELDSIRALETDTSITGIKKIKLYKGMAIVPQLISEKIIAQLYPLHDKEELKVLAKEWYQTLLKPQPIEKIQRYFGESIAMYFSFLGFYTMALVPPAAVGLFSKIFTQSDLDLVIFFSFFNLIWATIFLESWKRNCATLAYQWGTVNMEPFSKARASYYGELGINPVTGRLEPQYPKWKRTLKLYTVSLPVVMLCLYGAVEVMLVYFYFEDLAADFYREHPSVFGQLVTLLPSTGYAIVIIIMSAAYNWLAKLLTTWENHRLESSHENHLIFKLVLFNFINWFLSFFYIAFKMKDMEMLRRSLAILLIVQQLFQQCQEALLPYIIYKYNKKNITKSHQKQNVEQKEDSEVKQTDMCDKELMNAEIEATKTPYLGTLDDYLELFMQFGYVFLFSAVYPTAAFWALVNNVVEIRSDAFKLCRIHQRPFARPTSGIGIWQFVFEAMSAIAVMTNCALVACSPHIKSWLPDQEEVDILMWFVLAEHVILVLKLLIAVAIPDQPGWIRVALKRVEFESKQIWKEQRLKELALAIQQQKGCKDDDS